MEWTLERGGPELARLKLSGMLTLESAVELRDVLRQAIDAAREVVIELGGGAEVDLSCLQLFCAAHRAALSAGRSLSLDAKRPESFRRLVSAAGISRRQGCAVEINGCMLAGGQG